MSDEEMLKKAIEVMQGVAQIKVYDPDTEEYHTRTVDEILDSVNEAHSEDFIPYDHNDWVEGTIKECEEAIKKNNGVCKYCGGNCPDDEDNACDGYQGDIDGLYSK